MVAYEGMAGEARRSLESGRGISALNDLITRRLREYPGGRLGARRLWRSRGSPWILRSRLGPGCSRHTLRPFIWDPEVFSLGPGTETGARRRSYRVFPLDPEIVSGPWCIWTLRSCGDPEVVWGPGGLDPEISGWNPEELGGSSLDPEILLIGTRRLWGNPEGLYSAFLGKTATGTCLDFAFCRSEAGHYRVPMLYYTSAGTRSVLIQAHFTLVLWGPRCALGCTGVLGSFDSILSLAHTPSCFMSHTRFDSLWACHCGRATFVRVGQDRRSLET
ncbi:hypothetical protein F2Q68_00043874 [Brassica cretica]|uniref:Uncharacterized protein n=1 Tax=Brassica cretica TaxID=69181 RepID=A0A8S9LEK7_BRACR|nr:hypothetical protein F2Q68_00043874 [Brassica cretica]